MIRRASYFAVAALTLALAPEASATIVGSTYTFATSDSGNTVIDPLGPQGTFTDPANPTFCVVSTSDTSCSSNGLSGSFSFAQVTPTLDRITFRFQGFNGSATGAFTIELGDFVTTDGETITGITYNSGTLFSGDFSSVTWDGTDAVFTGTTPGSFIAFGGASIVFDVTTAPASVSQPASLILLAGAVLGLGAVRFRRTNCRSAREVVVRLK